MTIFNSLKAKLILLAGIPILGLIISAIIAMQGITSLESSINAFSKKRLPITQLISEVRIQMNAISRLVWQALASQDQSSQTKTKANIQNRIAELEVRFTDLSNIGLVSANKINLEKLRSLWNPQKEKYQFIVANLNNENAINLQNKMVETIAPADEITEILLAMGKIMDQANKNTTQEAQTVINQVKMIMISCSIIVSIIGFLWATLLNINLNKTFSKISDDLDMAGTQVESASEEMSKSSQLLSSSSVEGAASLEETVASLDEINTQVSLNSERSLLAQNLSSSAKTLSQTGESQLKNLLTSISEIEVSSNKIQDIIGIIDDIAFQTNLLSLNAAVEAARAGDQGKGFAVVADAVRSLSQRTANSAKEISKLISESAVKTVSGVQLASSSHKVLQEVFTVIEKLANLNNEIAIASKEQSLGLQQISIAINQLDSATQSNAAAAEETSSTAEELSAQSRELHKLVNQLVCVVHGSEVNHAVVKKTSI